MMYDKGQYTLKSGRIILAHGGILGLAPPDDSNSSGDVLALYDGYDGVRGDELRFVDSPPYMVTRDLTQNERYEIAAEMIYRWLRWSDAINGGGGESVRE